MSDIELKPFAAPQLAQASERAKSILPSLAAQALGLKQFRQIGRKGDLLAILTSITLQGERRAQPALVLANRHSPRERSVFVPLNHLWRYLEPTAMRNVAPELAQRLYGHVTRQDCFRIIDALYEFADDLIHAPPPEWMSTQQWLEAVGRDGFTITKDGEALNG